MIKFFNENIKKFNNAFTLSYKSFKTHKLYLDESMRSSQNQDLKDIEIVENSNIKKKFTDETGGKIPYNERIKINFNFLEKFLMRICLKLIYT